MATLQIAYDYGSLGLSFDADPIYITYTITEPAFDIPQTVFDFGALETDFAVNMVNDGQGSVSWSVVNASLFPLWLNTSTESGTVDAESSGGFRMWVDRDFVTGPQQYVFVVTTDIGSDYVITVDVLPSP